MDNTEKIKSLYEKGCKLIEENQANSAIEIFNEILSLDSGFYKAYFQRAHSYMSLGKIDNAISDFDNAINIKKDDAILYLMRATALDTKKMFKESSEDYRKVIELEPDPNILYFAHLNRGSAFNDLEKYSDAVKDFTKAIGKNSEDPKAIKGRAVAYFHLKQIDNSINDWSTVIKLTPNDAEAYKKRASLYIQKSKIEETISDCDKSLNLDPKDSETYLIRGSAYYEKGDIQKAISDLQKASDQGNEVAAQTLKQIEEKISKNHFKLKDIEPFNIPPVDNEKAEHFFKQLTGNEAFILETDRKPLSMILFYVRNDFPKKSYAKGLLLSINVDDFKEKSRNEKVMEDLFNEFAIASITIEIGDELKEPKLSIQKDWKKDFDKEQSSSNKDKVATKKKRELKENKKGCLFSIVFVLSIIIIIIVYLL